MKSVLASSFLSHPPPWQSPGFAAPPLRILVVDDEESVRTLVSRVLREAGFETIAATNGLEAMVVADTQAIDLALVDLEMPLMTGDRLAQELRQVHPALKVLYLTGHSARLFANRSLLDAGEAFLDKPTTAMGILEAIRQLIGHPSDATGARR
jgi:CheY-like chemotaxis protein